MKTKLNLTIRILATALLGMLTIAFLWLTHLAIYYLHYIGWGWAVIISIVPFLQAVLCALGIVIMWTENYCEWYQTGDYMEDGRVYYETDCKEWNARIIVEDLSAYKYCPYCGKKIRIKE